MTLSSYHLLPDVIAALPRQLRRFHALAIQGPGGWLFVTTCESADLRSKRVMKPLPRSIIAPLLEIGVHTLPGRILPRQHAPLTATDDNVHDRIDHRSHLQCARSPSWLCRGDQVFDTIPTFGRLNRLDIVGCFSYLSVPPRLPGCHPFSNRL